MPTVLRLCLVDTGQEMVQVVCGAPNARTGMKGVFAAAGTYIPGTEMTLKPGNIRGEASNGMLCSERELMLSDDHDGIIDLPADAPVGARYVDYAGLDDPVIDIAITPNRADCLGVRGVARDLAAAGLGTLKPLDTSPVAGDFDSPIQWRLEFAEGREHLCPLVAGRYFRGVKNGPSPKWMQDRLIAVGLRPISALVDITNYVMIDVGRPLHAYDADKVDGDIIIRQAKPGEKYLALNGREYTFDPEMIVIGDQHGPDDLAGIMGGEKTGCGDDTTNMFLEVAVFDETAVAATGRKLNLQSDARYRFERGLDQTSPHWGTELATKLVLEICGGSASTVVVDGPGREWRRQIPLRHSRIKALCGVEVAAADALRILVDLGFEVTGEGEAMTVTPPPWRGDIDGEADLIEEIVRINGFDKIEAVSMTRPHVIGRPALTSTQRRVRLARRALAHRGMVEALTFSFMPADLAARFGGDPASLRLVNPISSDLATMRPSILPNLLAAADRNLNHSVGDIALFEVGPQYADDSPEGQATVAAGLRVGDTGPRDWSGSSAAGRRLRRQSRRPRPVGRDGRADRQSPGLHGRARLVSPGPLRQPAPGSQRNRLVRRNSPSRAGRSRHQSRRRRVRGVSRPRALAQGQTWRSWQAHADPLTVPAGDPRLRLYRRPGGYRRELAARRQRRRQGADRRRRFV